MNPIILVLQVVLQFAWGIACFLYSPHNILLSILNASLITITVASHFAGDNEELVFQKLYLATWVIPGFILACSSLAGLFEIQNIALQQVGISPIKPPLEGSSSQYAQVFENFVISQLIPPIFRLFNWLLNLIKGR